MNKILLSGFGPFLDISNNPSETVVRELANDFNLAFVILPVVFAKSFEVLREKFFQENPDVVLMFGVAATRSAICLEKIGLNWVESKNPDVSQNVPRTGKIDSHQELALMTSFSVEKVISHFSPEERKHIEISYSAGSYVCNDLYFRMLNDKNIKGEKLFIHIPPFEKMDEQTQKNLLRKIIQNALQ